MLKLHPEGDVGEWLVKRGHASFASVGSLSSPPALGDCTSPLANHTPPPTDHTFPSLRFHPVPVMDELRTSQSNDDDNGLASEPG